MSKPKVMIRIIKEVKPYNQRYGRRNRRPLAVGTTMSAALHEMTDGHERAIVPIEWRRNGLIDHSCYEVLDVVECLALRAHPNDDLDSE